MVDQYTIAWRMMLVLLWDTMPQNIMVYKNNTDFNIVNWAKRNIKILTIKTRYTVIITHAVIFSCSNTQLL